MVAEKLIFSEKISNLISFNPPLLLLNSKREEVKIALSKGLAEERASSFTLSKKPCRELLKTITFALLPTAIWSSTREFIETLFSSTVPLLVLLLQLVKVNKRIKDREIALTLFLIIT